MSSVLGLKVTPKKVIFLFLILLFKILYTLFAKIFFLSSFDLITVFTIERSVLKLFATSTKAFVSLGKQEPP